jgi:hypothetical protein
VVVHVAYCCSQSSCKRLSHIALQWSSFANTSRRIRSSETTLIIGEDKISHQGLVQTYHTYIRHAAAGCNIHTIRLTGICAGSPHGKCTRFFLFLYKQTTSGRVGLFLLVIASQPRRYLVIPLLRVLDVTPSPLPDVHDIYSDFTRTYVSPFSKAL